MEISKLNFYHFVSSHVRSQSQIDWCATKLLLWLTRRNLGLHLFDHVLEWNFQMFIFVRRFHRICECFNSKRIDFCLKNFANAFMGAIASLCSRKLTINIKCCNFYCIFYLCWISANFKENNITIVNSIFSIILISMQL